MCVSTVHIYVSFLFIILDTELAQANEMDDMVERVSVCVCVKDFGKIKLYRLDGKKGDFVYIHVNKEETLDIYPYIYSSL